MGEESERGRVNIFDCDGLEFSLEGWVAALEFCFDVLGVIAKKVLVDVVFAGGEGVFCRDDHGRDDGLSCAAIGRSACEVDDKVYERHLQQARKRFL